MGTFKNLYSFYMVPPSTSGHAREGKESETQPPFRTWVKWVQSTIIWWIYSATYRSFSEVHNLVTYLCAFLSCPSLAYWFGPSCSTWRLWPMSTSAMAKSSTVWTSWSTWHVSTMGQGHSQFSGLARISSMVFAAGRGILWIFMSVSMSSSVLILYANCYNQCQNIPGRKT